MQTPATDRLHALDGLRGAALLLGVVFHAALSFLPTPANQPMWIIMDTDRSVLIGGTAFILHIFRMTLFFLLAGYFGRMLMERHGTKGFIRNRVKRVAAPFAGFWWISFLAVVSVSIWGYVVQQGGVMPENPPPTPPLTIYNVPLTHLWFLYLLVIFYVAMLVVSTVLKAVRLDAVVARVWDGVQTSLLATPLMPVLLAAPTAWAFSSYENWIPWFGIPAPDHGLVPNTAALIAYGTAITVGWNMHRVKELIFKLEKTWALNLTLAVILSAVALHLIGAAPAWVSPLTEETKVWYIASYSAAIWFWTFGLIGAALCFWSKQNAVRRYIADASYWVYIIHLPIVMALQVIVYSWAIPAELKLMIMLAVSLPVMFLSYHWLVRFTWLGKWLNGRKHERKPAPVFQETEIA